MKTRHRKTLTRFMAWCEHDMPRLFNYVSYQVKDQSAAEELTSQICERALTHLHLYDPGKGTLNTWIFAIARNTIHNYRRSLSRRPTPVSLDALPEIQADGQSVEEAVAIGEAFKAVIGQLDRLPEREQEVIALRYGAGLSNQEIAGLTGLNAAHVGVVLHRALKKLRVALIAETEAHHVPVK